MAPLGGSRYLSKDGRTSSQDNRWFVYTVGRPPHYVLNGLERLAGYKVLASNSITEHENSHRQVWTLHKEFKA